MKKLVIAVVLASAVVACSPTPPGGGSDAGPPPSCDDAGGGGGDSGAGIARTWSCSFSDSMFAANHTVFATNCSDTNVLVDVAYSASETSTGDVLVNALLDAPGQGPPTVDTASAAQLWPAGSAGAADAEVTLTDDICWSGHGPQPGTWTFSLDKATGVLTSLYTDADIQGGSLTFTTPCTVDTPGTAE